MQEIRDNTLALKSHEKMTQNAPRRSTANTIPNLKKKSQQEPYTKVFMHSTFYSTPPCKKKKKREQSVPVHRIFYHLTPPETAKKH